MARNNTERGKHNSRSRRLPSSEVDKGNGYNIVANLSQQRLAVQGRDPRNTKFENAMARRVKKAQRQ